MDAGRLADLVGRQWTLELEDVGAVDLIPLPHPSGASTWFKTEPGKTLLARALTLIEQHPVWRTLR
jgi:uracil-DNA glycosylase